MVEKGYSPMTMPANSWNGQTEEVETFCGCETLVVTKDMPVDMAYAITKALFENLDAIAALVPSMGKIDVEKAHTAPMCGIELHPGAVAYYKEVGLM
jgi:TRAP transporter TAXI family solute receptor